MLRNLVGALVGSQVTKQIPIAGGTAGAILGSAIPFALRRMSLPVILAVGAGGYFYKKHLDKKRVEESEVQVGGTSIDGKSLDKLPAETPVGETDGKTKPAKDVADAGSPYAPLVSGGGVDATPVPVNG
ncbi:hypothetical protein [Erythrobacter sp.]|jgi:hypothetical protein|uniref:hypothetical protein n=1 Tax=Erythrobacter sp. TaxID=1042 RepID=UPI002E99D248|nr:hypothetical protein [Erythrobacter sp.]